MASPSRIRALAGALLVALAAACERPPSPQEIESHRIRGWAHYHDGNWLQAEQEFEQALDAAGDAARADDLVAAGATTLRGSLDYEKARDRFERALEIESDSAAALFGLGIALLRLQDYDGALARLKAAHAAAPADRDAMFWLADTHHEVGEDAEAAALFERLIEADPVDAEAHYKLAMLLRQSDPERSQRLLDRSQELKDAGTTSRDAADPWSILFDPRLQMPPAEIPPIAVAFEEAGRFASGSAAFDVGDVDGDCKPDAFAAGVGLFLNDGGFAFRDATRAAGLVAAAQVAAERVRLADFDNDGSLDLLLAAPAGNRLFRNDGSGRFADVTTECGIARPGASEAIVVDYDHEGDLDLFLIVPDGDGAATRLLQNTLAPVVAGAPPQVRRFAFRDVTEEAGVAFRSAGGGALCAVAGDLDGGNDTDLVVLDAGGDGALFRNLRLGRFDDIGDIAGIRPLRAAALEAGDLDGDGWLDLARLAPSGALSVVRNAGDGTFLDPVELGADAPDADGFALVDFDNDGDLDLAASGKGLTLFRNHRGAFTVEPRVLRPQDPTRALVPSDLDGDGDPDLLGVVGAGLTAYQNKGGNRHRSLKISLDGFKSNALGVGCRIEAVRGGLHVVREVGRSPTLIGLGPNERADALMVTWSNGVRQPYLDVDLTDASWTANWKRRGSNESEVESVCDDPAWLRIVQIDRRGGSCPLLYAWNGTRFEYVADVLCSSPLGLDLGGGLRAQPNPHDWVRLRGDQLRPRDGKYELRFTEELREIAYLDRVRLLAVDHPADVDVFVDGRFTFPPFPEFELYPVRERRPLAAAVDDRGEDVLDALAALDRKFVDGFARCAPPMQGMAAMHALTLDLGDLAGRERVRLILDGWFYWTNSSVNRAQHQDGSWRFTPPMLEVGDGRGGFTPAGMVGLPAGDHKPVVVDLTGKLVPGDSRIRITTNCQVYWDRAFVGLDAAPESLPLRVTELAPRAATLRFRGYSERVFPGGTEPHVYDYEAVTADGSTYGAFYGRHAGRFTRYGDVMELVDDDDDRYVLMQHGDEVALAFDVADAPRLDEGWTRTFVWRAVGWAKDMDFHSAEARTAEPLPFRAMSAYPYPTTERYPDDDAHRAYLRDWNTRVVVPKDAPAAPRLEPSMPAPANAQHVVFTDVTAAAGIEFRHAEGRILRNLEETMGPGAAFGDADGDGDDDLYLVQGAGPDGPHRRDVDRGRYRDRLYRNDGGCRFTDVTEIAGLGDAESGMGALFADFDNDGDQDLYVTNYGPNVLYRNDGGLHFTDVTAAAGVGDAGYGAGAAAGDVDRDGDLDLYVGNYVVIDPAHRPSEAAGFRRGFVRDDPPSILPMAYPPAQNVLYRNDGGLRFTDVTERAGVADPNGRTLGVLCVDLDGDGWLDLYCANDVSPNTFYRNRGDGTFEDLSFDVGLDDPRGGMGLTAVDVDDDTDLDLAVTYWQTEPDALYRNNVVRHDSRKARVPSFEDIAHPLGLAQPTVGAVGWGIDVSDLDNDADLDALIVNGYTGPDYETTDFCLPQPALLFLGGTDAGGRFAFEHVADLAFGAFLATPLNGRGLAVSDVDADGDLDVAITQNNGRALLLRTDAPRGGAWLEVSLAGTKSPRDPAGARVEVKLGDRVVTRVLQLGSSYLCGNTKTLHFGLGPHERHDGITVHWPSGSVTRLSGGEARRRIAITEPDGE